MVTALSLKCPDCGVRMRLGESRKYTYTLSGSPKLYYYCPACHATHGAHPDGTPVGKPANKETRQARRDAHIAFEVWRDHYGMTRNEAYLTIAVRLGIPEQKAHMGNMDLETCQMVIDLCTQGREVNN